MKKKDLNSYEISSYDYRKEILSLQNELRDIKFEKARKEEEIEYQKEVAEIYHKELNSILNSSSWKVTAPLRKAVGLVKKKKSKNIETKDINTSTEQKGNSYKDYPAYTSQYQEDIDFSSYKTDIKALAFYLPQYHTFKENDEWWGKGFMEWTNTKKALPKFEGHYQPRIPHKDIGYYTLDNIETIKKQVELAKRHGLYGFCFYYYWFSGKRLMEKPGDLFLNSKEIDFPFCLCWANENWTRRWDGLEQDVLIKQDYSKEDYKKFIVDLKKYVSDSRYIRIDGKPVILIYNPSAIPDYEELVTKWKEYALEEGIGEIYICSNKNLIDDSNNFSSFVDAEFDFAPHGIRSESAKIIDLPAPVVYNYKQTVSDFEDIYKNHFPLKPFYYSCTMGWDNSARRKTASFIYYNYNIKSFYKWIRIIVKETRRRQEEDKRFIFINAWNEWAEGTYLEPDEKYGYANINTLSKAIFDLPFSSDNKKKKKCSKKK